MRKFLVLLMMAFAINFANAETEKPKERTKTYRSAKHRKKMLKRSQRAYDNMCNNKHFYHSSYGTYQKKK
jgi:DNA invertase Pin-like site-specific DNA recombinase